MIYNLANQGERVRGRDGPGDPDEEPQPLPEPEESGGAHEGGHRYCKGESKSSIQNRFTKKKRARFFLLNSTDFTGLLQCNRNKFGL